MQLYYMKLTLVLFLVIAVTFALFTTNVFMGGGELSPGVKQTRVESDYAAEIKRKNFPKIENSELPKKVYELGLNIPSESQQETLIANAPHLEDLIRKRFEWLEEVNASGLEVLLEQVDNNEPRATVLLIEYLAKENKPQAIQQHAITAAAMFGAENYSGKAAWMGDMAYIALKLGDFEYAAAWRYLSSKNVSLYTNREFDPIEELDSAIWYAHVNSVENPTQENAPNLPYIKETIDEIEQQILEYKEGVFYNANAVSPTQLIFSKDLSQLVDDGEWWSNPQFLEQVFHG